MRQNILIAIPVYNERQHILALLDQTAIMAPGIPVLIVDDGSADGTPDLLENKPLYLIRHGQNRGKGAALMTAVRYAKSNHYEWIITLDGDGQHPPEHLPAFIDAISTHNCDLVLGNRQSRSVSMPWHRRFSNGTTSIMVSLCCGQRIHDSQCGYRAIRVNALHERDYRELGFQFESEMILRMGKQGSKITEIPVSTRYNGQASSIHLVKDTLRFVNLIIKSFFW